MSGMGWMEMAGFMHDATQDWLNFGLNLGNSIDNWKTSKQNRETQLAYKNWDFANHRTSRAMLENYENNGVIAPVSLSQDYDDVADTMTPYLQLHNVDMSKKQYEMSKDLAYNGVQRRVEDLKQAGLSPLLSIGQTAQYTPTAQNAAPGQSAMLSNPGSLGYSPGFMGGARNLSQAANAYADSRLKNAQADFVKAQTDTELEKPANIKAMTENIEAMTGKTTKEVQYLNAMIDNVIENTNLTKAQILKIESEYKTIVYNLEQSIISGVRTTDELPFMFNQISDLVDSTGLDGMPRQMLELTLYYGLLYAGLKVKGTPNMTKRTTIRDSKGNGKVIDEKMIKETGKGFFNFLKGLM